VLHIICIFSDIKDRSILRLREHNSKTPTPLDQPQSNQPPIVVPSNLNPAQFDDDLQYYSESELDMADLRARRNMQQQSLFMSL
jgi:hypothetical protein